MTYFFNIYIYYVDIFIIVFYLLYYCNIRYVVLSFDEIKTHHYYLFSTTKLVEFLLLIFNALPCNTSIYALHSRKKILKVLKS